MGTAKDVVKVSAQIPEFDLVTTRQTIEQRMAGKRGLILVASVDNVPIGFKVGYSLSEDTFYSWIGGVIPRYRGQGIASLLLNAQEKWAVESGFTRINVKSMNRYPSMLKLLVSNNYQITGIEKSNGPDDKIFFSKKAT